MPSKKEKLKALRPEWFLSSRQVSKQRCLLFILNCQWVFRVVLRLLLCTISASNPVPKFLNSFFKLNKREVTSRFGRSAPAPLCLHRPPPPPLPPTFSRFYFNTKSFSLQSLYSPSGWKKCCVYFSVVFHPSWDMEAFQCRAWLPLLILLTNTHKQLFTINSSLTKLAALPFPSLTFLCAFWMFFCFITFKNSV